MRKVSLDLHDFSVIRNRLDLLLKIKEHYPAFKVSLFTVPWDMETEVGTHAAFRASYLKKIHENLDWMQIIPHGLTHMEREFEKADRWATKLAIKAMDEAFTKDGLPYERGFCAPYWLWNKDVVDVLDELGWWGAIDRNQPDMVCPKKFYKYSHSIDEAFWESTNDVLKLHGHMTRPSSNNLEDCLTSIFKLPTDIEWVFVTEFLEEKQ